MKDKNTKSGRENGRLIRFFFAAAVYLSLSGKRMLLLLHRKQRIASGDWL
ncbi:hypothetical protein [Bacteroides pyogenes]|nr:hypothetical protein [Bacteroides pyogenes]MDY5354376.1 hypothetical protein [Bacteroides pyogenes]MDY5433287.1 hypothetical protein [Bacteroides pyogenes]